MKKLLLTMCVCLIVSGIAGCETVGDQTKLTQEATETIDKVAGGAEIAQSISGVVSIYWPPAALIAGVIGGALGIWRQLKPQVTEAQAEASLYYSTTEAVVTAIEEFKENCPDGWEELEKRLVKVIGPKAESIIRALRGLPEKI